MSINLELPKKLRVTVDQAHQAAAEIFRPISRKYDLREHDYPVELDTLASLYDGLSETGQAGAGADGGRSQQKKDKPKAEGAVVNGGNMQSVVNVMETSWGDVGLMLSIPYQGLGNSAIAAVALFSSIVSPAVYASWSASSRSRCRRSACSFALAYDCAVSSHWRCASWMRVRSCAK